MTVDPYEALGVPRTASAQEIKRAYRRLARRYHPDHGARDDDRFRKVQAAYDLLRDSERRQPYDTSPPRPTKGRRERRADFDLGVEGVVRDVVGGVVSGLGGLLRKAGSRVR